MPEEGKYELNPDHTNFIVVRDSTVSKTGINMFILRMIQYLSTGAAKNEFAVDALDKGRFFIISDFIFFLANIIFVVSRSGVKEDICTLSQVEIPVVSIVVQGGYEAARLVLDHLKKYIPVVVLRGSGGLADLLAYAFTEMQQRCRDITKNWDAEFVESYLKPELSTKIVNHFPKLRDNTLARNIFRDRILESVRFSKQQGKVYLTILNMHNSSCNLHNLSEYLLMALFKSQHSERKFDIELFMKDLYLTLDWNCPHVARNEVLIKDPSSILKLEKSMFEAALTRPNREEFVDLFLSHGFRAHKFVTPSRLKNLFKRIHDQEFFRSVCWEGVLGHSSGARQSKHFIDSDLNWLIEACTGLDDFVNSDHLYLNVMGMYPTTPASAERKAIAILAMWAVFTNRQKLAKVLWKHSDQPIHLGLVLSMMFDRLSWYVGEQSLKNELSDHSKLFADYATGVLDACYAEATSRASDVLSEASPDWNYKTAVDIAANAHLRAFLAHPCCQKWLTNTFLGSIRIRELSWGFFTIPPSLKILLCAFLIFPMYIWVRFKEVKKEEKQEETEDEKYDEKDAFEEDLHLGNMRPGGDVQHVNEVSVQTHVFMKAAEGIVNNINTITKQSDHYATFLRDREVFIRQQPPLWKMIFLMWTAPITKFWTFQLFYIFYLALFSIAVIWPGCGNWFLDTAVCAWTALIVIEYIRRTYILYKKYTSVPLVFKCLEIIAIVLFTLTYTSGRVFGLTFYSPYTKKIILCLGLLYFYYRLIAIYLPISPTLGPLLHRLRLMITVDFLNFMRMALLVIVSSGIVIQTVLYPDRQLDGETFRVTFHRAFFSLFLTPADELVSSKQFSMPNNSSLVTTIFVF